MKLIGLIGGMSWENTIDYYRMINKIVQERFGDWNSAEILLYSLNFQKIIELQNQDKWAELVEIMTLIAKKLELANCKAILICSNTMHRIASEIETEISIPLINVVDETAKAIKRSKIKTVGLLGTRFTMEGTFYTTKLAEKYDISTLIPDSTERDYIHRAIYQEFAIGSFLKSTKTKFLKIIERLIGNGAEGIILGCTELPLLLNTRDVRIPLFDTLEIHLTAAVDFAVS